MMPDGTLGLDEDHKDMLSPTATSDPAAAVSGPRTAPSRRRRRWLLWIGLVLLLIATAATLTARHYLQNERLGQLLEEQLSTLLGAPVSLRFERSGLNRWELLDLAIGGDSLAMPIVQLERLGFYPRPGFLWERRLRLDSLVVQGLQLNLAWNDSLIIPAWLMSSDSSDTADSSSVDTAKYLRLLADYGWRVDSTRLTVRNLRLSLSGSQNGRPLALASPPLQLDMRLPELDPGALRVMAEGKVPPRLLASLLMEWSGDWRDSALGSGLRPVPLPPGVLQSLQLAGLDLERNPEILQGLELRLDLARDTLVLGAALDIRPSDLSMRYAKQSMPLPRHLGTEIELAWPVQENPLQARATFNLELEGKGLSTSMHAVAQLRQLEQGWKLQADWEQQAGLQLSELGEMGQVLELPEAQGNLSAELSGALTLDLGADFATGTGRWSETLSVAADSLVLPGENLGVYGLQLKQSLTASLDLALPLPRDPLLTLNATMARLGLGLAPLDDPRDISLNLELRGSGVRDSLLLGTDLSIADWQGGRVDISAGAHLPGLAEWMEEYESWLEQPQRFQLLPFQLDLETSLLSLDGLDPLLSGGVRASAHVETRRGLRFQLEAVPAELRLLQEGMTLDLPLHRVEIEGGAVLGNLFAAMPWPDTLWAELRPDPLPPMQLRMRREGLSARLLQDWKGFDLPSLLALVPAEWLPADLNLRSGRASLKSNLLLGVDGMPSEAVVGLDLSGVRVQIPGWGLEGVEGHLGLTLDTLGLDYQLDGRVEELKMLDPAWSWDGLSLQGGGRLEIPLGQVLEDSLWQEPGRGGAWAADGSWTLGLQSLDLTGGADLQMAEWRNLWPDLVRVNLAMGSQRELRPWPGLRMTGRSSTRQELRHLGAGRFTLSGVVESRLDSLDWNREAGLQDLVLELPFSQTFTMDSLLVFAVDARRSPVNWNALRAWDRRQPDFSADRQSAGHLRDGQGWSLRIARANYGNWSMEAFTADLRVGPGRLDIPEFRFALFGGGVRGSAEVVGIETTSYALDCSLIGLDSRYFEFGDKAGTNREEQSGQVNAVLHLEGSGLDLGALDQLRGQLRIPDLDRQVTLNLLRALDAQGVDPSIGRIRRLLELPGFRYRVERVDFDIAHGFARPRVSLRKSPFSPLPDVAIPMSPLPLGFMVRNFALVQEDAP